MNAARSFPLLWPFLLALVSAMLLTSCGDRPRSTPSTTSKPPPTAREKPKTTERTAAPADLPPTRPASPEDWPLYLHDAAQTGTSPDTTLKPPLRLAWAFQTRGAIVASPIVVGDTVYIGSKDRRLYALDARRWGERWRFVADGEIHRAAAYANGVLVFADVKANLYGLNAETGALLWRAKLGGWTSSPPVYADGFVWVGIHPKTIVGYDPSRGGAGSRATSRKTIGGVEYATDRGTLQPVEAKAPSVPTELDLPAMTAPPVRAGETIFAGFTDGSLRAFDVAGNIVWEEKVPGGIEGAPAIARGFLYVPSTDGTLYAFASAELVEERPPFDGEHATIVAWEASAYEEPAATEPTNVRLNEGWRLPLLETRDGWAKVALPNDRIVWVAPDDWAVLRPAMNDAPFRQNRDLAEVRRSLLLPTGAEMPVWSPDGSSVAFYVRRNLSGRYWQAESIWRLDTKASEVKALLTGAFYNPALSWSLDGAWIAFETYEETAPVLAMVNAAGSEMRRIGDGMAPAWSPVANQVAFLLSSGDKEGLWRVNGDGTDAVKITEVDVRGFISEFRPRLPPAWHPKGAYLAFGAGSRYYPDGKARLIIVGTTEKARKTVIQTPAEEFVSLEWSPDGRKIAAVLVGHVGGSVADPLDQRVTVYWFDQSHPPVSYRHTNATWIDANRLAYVELPRVADGPSRIWLVDVESGKRSLLLEADVPVTRLTWVPERERLSVWSTSSYFRDGKYQPAETRGWLVRIRLPKAE